MAPQKSSNPFCIRHKVFLSYYHREDQFYRDEFEYRFGHLFVSKSVGVGEIDSDLSDHYIKRLIREEYITDSSVLIVLVGPNTKGRKHVDWEISAALSKKAGGYSGLLGILLPTFTTTKDPRTGKTTYRLDDLPPRLADNVRSGFADVCLWPREHTRDLFVQRVVELAFQKRKSDCNRISNSRPQFPEDWTPNPFRDLFGLQRTRRPALPPMPFGALTPLLLSRQGTPSVPPSALQAASRVAILQPPWSLPTGKKQPQTTAWGLFSTMGRGKKPR